MAHPEQPINTGPQLGGVASPRDGSLVPQEFAPLPNPQAIRRPFPLSVPQTEVEFDPEREELRKTVLNVQEVNTEDPKTLHAFSATYLKLLKRPANRSHFTNIPPNVEAMKEELSRKSNHGLAIYDALEDIVGFAIISDAERDQSDNWLNKMVIVNNLQNKKDRKSGNVGTQALDKIVEWAFTHQTDDGRDRNSLHAAMVMYVPNFERMDRALLKSGFHFVSRLDSQAMVTLRNGKRDLRPVQRFEINRETWELNKLRRMQANTPTGIN